MAKKAGKKERPWLRWNKEDTEEKKETYNRIPSAKEYHTARWTRQSKLFREANPLCAMCKKEGRIVPAEVVDHIIPYPICQDFFDNTNWQSLCRKCNLIKGNRDKKIIQEFKNKR